jgi:hypothetical protein
MSKEVAAAEFEILYRHMPGRAKKNYEIPPHPD